MGSKVSKSQRASTPSTVNSRSEKPEWKPLPPTSPAPPAYAAPSIPPRTDTSAPAPVSDHDEKPSLPPVPSWWANAAFVMSGEVTLITSDEHKLKTRGGHMSAASAELRRRLTFERTEEPILHLTFQDKTLETWAIMALFVDLMEGRDLASPGTDVDKFIEYEKLAKLLVKYRATTQIAALSLFTHKWMSERDTCADHMFQIAAILAKSRLCLDILKRYPNAEFRGGERAGRSLWDLSAWSSESLANLPIAYRDALVEAFQRHTTINGDHGFIKRFESVLRGRLRAT